MPWNGCKPDRSGSAFARHAPPHKFPSRNLVPLCPVCLFFPFAVLPPSLSPSFAGRSCPPGTLKELSRVVQVVSRNPLSKRSCPRGGGLGFQCRHPFRFPIRFAAGGPPAPPVSTRFPSDFPKWSARRARRILSLVTFVFFAASRQIFQSLENSPFPGGLADGAKPKHGFGIAHFLRVVKGKREISVRDPRGASDASGREASGGGRGSGARKK